MNENEKDINNEQGGKSTLSGKMIAVISSAAVAVVAIIACVAVLLLAPKPSDNGSDGGDNPSENTPVTYTITINDPDGNPVSDVFVYLVAADGTSKMRISGTDGNATYKNMMPADYTVRLEKGNSSASVPEGTYSITKGTTELTITLNREINTGNKMEIFGAIFGKAEDDEENHYYAYVIEPGKYNVELPEGMTYYVFYAKTSGIYEVKLESDDELMTVGYYGNPLNVFADDLADSEGKRMELEITPLNVGEIPTPYVIGVYASEATECVLSVTKSSNVDDDPTYHPWNDVPAAKVPSEQVVIPAGVTLVDFDITDRNLSVALGNDGYYYTNDNRLVYVRISTDSQYLAAFALIAGFMDENVAQTFGGYVYDEDGNYVRKDRFNTMIGLYHEKADEAYGVVPLTEELANAIMVTGNHNGWWNSESGGYRFSEVVGLYSDNAWLFACMVESK
ncbi:MAG: carboxypeptidase regulatory-like domain-containing protein [Clostridia bacterium]|nr:carboxypeptidase regulatory-like domain-containing protein [Clostridia bacterium]